MVTASVTETRRRFLAHFSGIGLGTTLLPGVLWGQMQQVGARRVTPEMLRDALAMSGLEFSEEDRKAMVEGVNEALDRYVELRKIRVPNNVSPPFHFSALVPGMTLDRTRRPFRMSVRSVRRPANLEDVAFWPVTDLAQLVRTSQVRSIELTEMYLDRLRRYNPTLNCVVTLTDDLALAQARKADAEIAAGRYRGPLHGIPWGAKDIISVRGYKTTWGSNAYKDQVIDEDASVVEMLRDAGAVLVAKLSTGELAGGDRWFGGQTKSPWNPEQGSSGSSAGPGSATAAGLVGFAIGTETSGSILGPTARNGVTGLRPTLGRVSRHGAMVLSWTQDRLGPMCRYAEDCALVMSVISRPDGRDMSVVDIPFNWDSELDVGRLRFGYLRAAFDEITDPVEKQAHVRALEQLQVMGLSLIEVKVPDFNPNVSANAVESATFFDELVRSGRDKELTRPERGAGMRRARVVPAVEYLHAQRVRMMMMMELAAATAHVDVYVAPNVYNGAAGDGGGGRGGGAGGAGGADAAGGGGAGGRGAAGGGAGAAQPQQPETVNRRHSNMANLATYPAVGVRDGFYDNGAPFGIVFFGRPFGETEVLSVAKAYQDATGFHLRTPTLAG